MSFIEVKTIKGNDYAYLRDSYRIGDKVRHHHLGYLGRVSSIQDRSISVERTEPISKPIRETIAVKVRESVITKPIISKGIPKADKQKRARFKLDIPVIPKPTPVIEGRKEQVRRVVKKKKKLVIPTKEEMEKEKEKYEDIFFPLGS